MLTNTGLYDQDLYAWTEEQAALLQAGYFDRNPSLRRTVPDELVDAYEIARVEAAGDLAVAEETMPTRCPWRVEQILDADFRPEVEAAR